MPRREPPDRSRRSGPDLFEAAGEEHRRLSAPLADRIRPETLGEFAGQEEIIGPGTVLRRAIEEDRVGSLVFWGPPGSGKTTLAKIIARETNRHFVFFSAVTTGIAEVREIVREAGERRKFEKRGTVLFIDEIHRFNKAQQDAFLPHVETGTITLIGATTENPSFEVISALLSRLRVFVLRPLKPEEIAGIIRRAAADRERGLASMRLRLDDEAVGFLAQMSGGDARVALNALELAAASARPDSRGARRITRDLAAEALQKKALRYDKSGEEHYNIISALHKSLRGSDVQAGLYWLSRMLEGGEDPLYIARRLVRFASEDVGMADPQALVVAIAAKEACDFMGMPECDTALAEVVVYLATAPKSNRLYAAMGEAKRTVGETHGLDVPLHIRNAPTRLMEELGYGADYMYDHNFEGKIAPQTYLPDELRGKVFYRPGELGFEREVAKRIAYWEGLRRRGRAEKPAETKAAPPAAEKPAAAPTPATPAASAAAPKKSRRGKPKRRKGKRG